tara:strand:- start:834 stop:2066 length:1233 start_codon:yes stop_codon:yes gene_type:complete
MSQKSMPNLNLHLEPNQELNPDKIMYLGESLTSSLGLLRKAQKKALVCILCNVAKYKDTKILFSMRNEANAPEQYNPFGLGNKPLLYAIEKLRKAKLLKVKKGTPYYFKNEADEFLEPQKSTLIASQELIDLCLLSIHKVVEQTRGHVELKSIRKKLLAFEPTPYTDHIDQLMSSYGNYLNKQTITVDGEPIEDIFLVRKYKDWSNTGSFQFGGRTHHPFMSYPKAKRARILINGQKTVAIDYPASVPNILYKTVTGNQLHPDDPYKVSGVPRSTAKKFLNIMLNIKGKSSVSGAVNKWLKVLASNAEKRDYQTAVKNVGDNAKIMDAVLKRNQPIAKCFFKGKAMGQHYAWLEANLVYEVANYLTQFLNIPCLTVHDEFIIPENRALGIEDYLYTVGLDSNIYRSKYFK